MKNSIINNAHPPEKKIVNTLDELIKKMGNKFNAKKWFGLSLNNKSTKNRKNAINMPPITKPIFPKSAYSLTNEATLTVPFNPLAA